MVQLLLKLLLKQRILAVYHDFHWLLVATKLLTAKLHIMLRCRSRKCWKGRSRTLYLRLRNPGLQYHIELAISKLESSKLTNWPPRCRHTAVTTRPVTSLGHQVGQRIFWEGPTFFQLWPAFWTMSNTFFQGRRKSLQGELRPPGYGPGYYHIAHHGIVNSFPFSQASNVLSFVAKESHCL